MCGGGMHGEGGIHGMGACMSGGHACQGGMRGRRKGPQQRTVRILFECILVLKYFQLYVRSSDVDRTIMSAECVLTGMYPTIPQQSWNPDYRWQPTSQHTVPEGEDHVSQFTSQAAYSNIRTKPPRNSTRVIVLVETNFLLRSLFCSFSSRFYHCNLQMKKRKRNQK